MCCQHRDRDTCGMWNTRTWFSSACGACSHMRWPGVSSDTFCTWHNKPHRGCCQWRPGNTQDGVVNTLQTKEARLLCSSCRLAAGRVHLRTCGRCESGGMRVGSVGIHDYVGIVYSPNEELHEEPARPAVVGSRLVQACNLVISQQEARKKRQSYSTLGQNFHAKLCEKACSSLAWCSQPQAVALSTVRACSPHACSQWTLSLGRGSCSGSCSGSGWDCGPSRRWHTDFPSTRIRTGHVQSASCRVP